MNLKDVESKDFEKCIFAECMESDFPMCTTYPENESFLSLVRCSNPTCIHILQSKVCFVFKSHFWWHAEIFLVLKLDFYTFIGMSKSNLTRRSARARIEKPPGFSYEGIFIVCNDAQGTRIDVPATKNKLA